MLKSINLAHVLHKKCIHKSFIMRWNKQKKKKVKWKRKKRRKKINVVCWIHLHTLRPFFSILSFSQLYQYFFLSLAFAMPYSELMVYWWWWDDDDDILYKTALREFNRHQAQNRLDYDFIQTIYSNLIFSIHLQYTHTQLQSFY